MIQLYDIRTLNLFYTVLAISQFANQIISMKYEHIFAFPVNSLWCDGALTVILPHGRQKGLSYIILHQCPAMHHFVAEMCTFLLQNGASWDIRLVYWGLCATVLYRGGYRLRGAIWRRKKPQGFGVIRLMSTCIHLLRVEPEKLIWDSSINLSFYCIVALSVGTFAMNTWISSVKMFHTDTTSFVLAQSILNAQFQLIFRS